MPISGISPLPLNHPEAGDYPGWQADAISTRGQDDPAMEEMLHLLARGDASKVLIAALSGRRLAKGADAEIYALPGYDRLLLRVARRFAAIHANSLAKNPFTVGRIDWPAGILEKKSLGVALGLVKTCASGNREETRKFTSLEDCSELLLLRKIEGGRPVDGYMEMMGPLFQSENLKCHSILDELCAFYSHQQSEQDGLRVARYVLEKLASGQSFEIGERDAAENDFLLPGFGIKKGEYGESARLPARNPGRDFCAMYHEFCQAYLRQLEDIAKMPQHAFDEAIRLIAEVNDLYGLGLDFQHPGNILVDVARGRFGLVDISLAKRDPSMTSNRLASAFGRCLFGWNCLGQYGGPHRVIFAKADVDRLWRSAEAIFLKLENASPGLGSSLRATLFKYKGHPGKSPH